MAESDKRRAESKNDQEKTHLFRFCLLDYSLEEITHESNSDSDSLHMNACIDNEKSISEYTTVSLLNESLCMWMLSDSNLNEGPIAMAIHVR